MPFPRAIDYHKPGKPAVPNGLGIFYVLSSSIYLFSLHFLGYDGSLPLASSILFGGFLGLFDDWADLKWRYKAILPVFASVPLISLRQGETIMATYILGKIDFGIYYYLAIAPLIVTVTTNTVNQLGGLNGLESVPPLIIMCGFIAISPKRYLLYVPVLTLLILAILNYRGKVFVGNVGSFSFGITLAAFAIIANIEQFLLISILPYVFNSSLILLSYFLLGDKASLLMDESGLLYSTRRRSLITLIAYRRRLEERRIVKIVALIFVISTSLALLTQVITT